MTPNTPAALIVLSGGQDSTTCLHWALREYGSAATLSFNYGQRHTRELACASRVAQRAGVTHTTLNIQGLLGGSSPLVDHKIPVGHYKRASDMPGGVEPTFVPGRNGLFLTIASSLAFTRGIRRVVTGVSQEDYGGYPDCRQEFISSLEAALRLGLPECAEGESITLDTPLINLDKKGTVLLAQELGPNCLDALAYTHTCYDGHYPPNPHNHASILRARGFRDAGIPDPLILRAKRSGLLPPTYPDHGLLVED